MALTIGLYVFAFIFFAVGVSRVVEFSNIGIKPGLQRFLMVAHVVGCALFAAVFVLITDRERATLTGALLAGALAILFPVHIYVGLKRRITIKDSDS